jgi:hypothetical protein
MKNSWAVPWLSRTYLKWGALELKKKWTESCPLKHTAWWVTVCLEERQLLIMISRGIYGYKWLVRRQELLAVSWFHEDQGLDCMWPKRSSRSKLLIWWSWWWCSDCATVDLQLAVAASASWVESACSWSRAAAGPESSCIRQLVLLR